MTRLKFLATCLCCIGLIVTCPTLAETAMGRNAEVAETMPDIEVFVREGCPHCAKAEEFLDQLKQERPQLHIVIHDVSQDPDTLDRLKRIAERLKIPSARVPAFAVGGQLILGYSDELTTGRLIHDALSHPRRQAAPSADASGSCEAEESLSCKPEPSAPSAESQPESFAIDFLGHKLSLDEIGLPAFTLAMGLLDGFNPCSMWVLILMISLLAPMNDRGRMLAIAGTFVAVEGIAYFVFMAAWLNLFLFIGLSRTSELVIAAIAILAGTINLKDFWAFGFGVSLSIPKSAKPGIYARIRNILQAKHLAGAIVGAVILAVLVQIVEFLCTSGFPALYTRILTLHEPSLFGYYGYLLLYNLAYMLDDIVILGIGVITLSQRRLQEKEGRWLKLISGLVMVGLGGYLVFSPR
ncbi:MAG: glutaredoxin [Methylococcaceae bacterium]|nr:glutaredoxin [Methylococcaceae bacterium]